MQGTWPVCVGVAGEAEAASKGKRKGKSEQGTVCQSRRAGLGSERGSVRAGVRMYVPGRARVRGGVLERERARGRAKGRARGKGYVN